MAKYEVSSIPVYRPRTDLHELLTENELWEDLYNDLYLKLKARTDSWKFDALTMLNEVYLQCVRAVMDRHPEDCFREKFMKHPLRQDSPLKRMFERDLCLSLSYVVLSLCTARDEAHVRTFRLCLEGEMKRERHFFSEAVLWVATITKDYNFEIIPENAELTPEQRCEQLEEELAALRSEMARMKAEHDKSMQGFVEAIVSVGEQYPSNQNDKADVVRSLLLEKAVNGHITSEVLTPEMIQRINAIGRKEVALSVSAECLYKVTGNENVNIGNTK